MFSRLRRIAARLGNTDSTAAGPNSDSTESDLDFGRLSFSQEGEDMILAYIFAGKKDGFYVDVGALHPHRFSNTYYFYLQGWRGINIDASPTSMTSFEKFRPRDTNLERAIADSKMDLTFHMFNEPALNGFSKSLAAERDGLNGYKIISEHQLQTVTLSEVLDEYLPADQTIDFLTVDVEGLDYEVLKSNDWVRYRPGIILAEDLGLSSLENLKASRIASFLGDQGYHLYCKTAHTLFFRTE